jgi:hypothetical protein
MTVRLVIRFVGRVPTLPVVDEPGTPNDRKVARHGPE